MSAEAEPIYRPESLDEHEDKESLPARRQILHFRHRIGDYDVTRVILDSTNGAKAAEK